MLDTTSPATPVPLSEPIRRTLASTFIVVGVMWLTSAATAWASLDTALTLGTSVLLMLLALGLTVGVSMLRNSGAGLALLGALAAVFGVLIGPALNQALTLKNGSELVITAALSTAAATSAIAAYALTARRSFARWRAFLFGALVVALVAGIAGMFIASPVFHIVLSAGTALLFLAYLLHDISAVVTGEETNYISASLNVYLDTLNLFLNLLKLLVLTSSDD